VLAGISTSGVLLSTVRDGYDRDYRAGRCGRGRAHSSGISFVCWGPPPRCDDAAAAIAATRPYMSPKIAGIAIRAIEPSSVDMKTAAVLLASAVHL
jgi:hypothetical protein